MEAKRLFSCFLFVSVTFLKLKRDRKQEISLSFSLYKNLKFLTKLKKNLSFSLQSGIDEGDIERGQWGELESESEESSEEESESEGEEVGGVPDESGLVTPAEGLVTPSGLTSVPTGIETPENIELRKKRIENEMDE